MSRNGHKKAADPARGAVTVAYIHPVDVGHAWHHSLTELVGWDLAHAGRIIRGGWIAMSYGVDGIGAARNKAVKQFLSESRAEWLWFIDTDMGFAANTVDRLVDSADPEKRPIVGALCFSQKEGNPDGLGGYFTQPMPTIYDWVTIKDEQQGFLGRSHYPVNALIRCAGTGAACLLIHRSALERVAKEHGEAWFDRIYNPTMDQVMGEDLSFCFRAAAIDIPVFVHTGIRTNHQKVQWIGEPDFWARMIAPPATIPTAVVVPVMKRPQNARPFMESLRASTGLASAYAIAKRDDEETIAAWLEAGATVIQQDGRSFMEKCNAGYRQTTEPWIFFTGDDVRFFPGWLDHAQHIAKMENAKVVGTNDLGNPRVMAGHFAVHWLVERSYIDEVGASWDGPGVVCHEGYKGWYADDEVVTAAKQRGVWGMALGSIVEHLHPLWGKGPKDEVYKVADDNVKYDQAHFRERLRNSLKARTHAPALAVQHR